MAAGCTRSSTTATACTRASTGRDIKLLTRTGLDWSHRYRSTIEALRSLPVKSAYLDGELCALRPDGVPALNREEFVVVGWTDPEGSRSHIGALLLGYYTKDGRLHYAGRAGTGITDKELKRLAGVLKRKRCSEAAFLWGS